MEYEIAIRLGAFFGLFALFAGLETALPKRDRRLGRRRRWGTNFAIVALDSVGLRLLAILLPLLAIGAALDAARLDLGLFNALAWPAWLEFLIAVLVFDLAIWAQHLVTHKVPLFWRFHRVHHADRDVDVTTGFRFHPVEILASMLLKIGLVYLIGPSALAVLIFEILLNGTAMFNHANLRLPRRLDTLIRAILVTPDMHRVHHSTLRREHDSNYGFALSAWDRIFRTYRPAPEGGHEGMSVGLRWQDERPARLIWSLALPFRKG
jgi:sterol desaturase/sphingolipid hydroxylase (fatty acid hydroxylase superfamily)